MSLKILMSTKQVETLAQVSSHVDSARVVIGKMEDDRSGVVLLIQFLERDCRSVLHRV